ncbi:MAG: hypothetical protein Q9184_005454 [Pyrenodesmia sp. 2 TL-2023]
MLQITDLSQEVLLQIIECLLEVDDPEPSKGGKEIADDSSDAISKLSRTSTYFYKLLSPYLFQRIVMRNTQKSGDTLQFLVGSGQSANVKALHFKASASESDADDDGKFEADLPSSVHGILSNLASFPNLQSLIVDFDFEQIQDRDFGDLIQEEDDDRETEEQIIEAERKQSWRALQKQIFDAISKEKSSHIRHLVVKTCPLKATSLFGSEQMNKVQSFSFEVYARDEGAGWCTNTFCCFRHYIANLDRYYLDALSNVTRLTISGHADGPIGFTDMYEALVPLRPDHLPNLRELKMAWYFIQDSFVDFLSAHASNLERLTLNHCFMISPAGATGDDWDDNEPLPDDVPSWYRFFHTYASSGPSALRHVIITPENATLEHDDDTEQVLKTCREQGSARRAFAYAEIDDKYGMLFENEEENSKAVRRGHDMRGWEELMYVVRANQQKMS